MSSLFNKGKFFPLFVFILCFFYSFSFSIVFKFDNTVGSKYRFSIFNLMNININNSYELSIEGFDKVNVEIITNVGNVAYLVGKYYYYEKDPKVAESFKLISEDQSLFYRDDYGRMVVDKKIKVPSLRGVPTFPQYDIKIGDKWSAPGEELIESSYAGKESFLIKFNVNYTYLSNTYLSNRDMAVFYIEYGFTNNPVNSRYVSTLIGKVNAFYYWDIKNQRPAFQKDNYYYEFRMKDRSFVKYSGKSEGIVELIPEVKEEVKQEMVKDIVKNLVQVMGNDESKVEKTEDAIILKFDNILFEHGKADLKEEFASQLSKVYEILKNYPQLSLFIAGHTDNTGKLEYNMQLSEKRAKAVADYLYNKGIPASKISYKGFGPTIPIADNSTEEGRKANRRVEIKILTEE